MPEAAEAVLSAQHLTKRFGRREAVADVSFDVHAGEVFGFLGPNGAGKTTTIRMLVGLARPDRGSVRIRGLDIASDFEAAMAHVGCIVEAPDLYRYLTGRENLLHFSRMLGGSAAERIDELAALVVLTDRLDDRVSTYSLGMRQRLGIAQALLGNPDVLILDEPANGLDPAGIREIRQLVRHLAQERGMSVFVSSHLLSEIELMCDRVAIVHRGRTLAAGPVAELLRARDVGPCARRREPARDGGRGAGALRELEAERRGRATRSRRGFRRSGCRTPARVRGRGSRRAHHRAARDLARGDLSRHYGRRDRMRVLGARRERDAQDRQAATVPRGRPDPRRADRTDRLRLVARARTFHAKDWHVEAQERMAWLQGRVRDSRTPPTALRWARFELARLQYHVDRDMNPEAISGAIFARSFANAASYLLLPLLAIVFASDIVSAEFAQGTIKLLLTRPVSRGASPRVQARRPDARDHADGSARRRSSRTSSAAPSTDIGGWGAPVADRLPRERRRRFDPSTIRSIALWKDAIGSRTVSPGSSTLCVGAIALLTSVVLRSTAAAMGTMVAALIAGSILPLPGPVLGGAEVPLRDQSAPARLLLRLAPADPGPDGRIRGRVLAAWAAAAVAAAFARLRSARRARVRRPCHAS